MPFPSLCHALPSVASLVAQLVKNLSAVYGTWVRFLGWEDPPEKGTATHSSILAWRIPRTKRAWQTIVHRVAKSRTLSNFHYEGISMGNLKEAFKVAF